VGIAVGVGVEVFLIVGALVFFLSSFSVQRKRKANDSRRESSAGAGNAADAGYPTQELQSKRNELVEAQAGERTGSCLELEGRRRRL
jgi:hypothetical protein